MQKKAAKPPAAPMYQAPQQYQQAPAYQDPYGESNQQNLARMQAAVPQVQNSQQVAGSALGEGVNADLSNYGSGWLSLKDSPNSQKNMQAAQSAYLAYAQPGLAQSLSDGVARGQGGSSYLGAQQGAQQGMNQLGSWQAGIAQNQADFQNQLAAYSQLYSGPIGLQQQQNQSDVNRGLGIAGLAQDSTNAANSYAMQNNQAQNSYNLGANQNRNQFALGRYQGQLGGYGTQTGANTQRGVGNQNFLGNAAQTIIGSRGLF